MGVVHTIRVKIAIFVKSLNFLIHGTLLTAFRAAKPQWNAKVREKLSDSLGICRDLSFWLRTKIFVFFEFLGLTLESVTALYERHFWLKVLKIVLDSDQTCYLPLFSFTRFPWGRALSKREHYWFSTDLFWIMPYRRNLVFVLYKHRGDQILWTEMKTKMPKCKF